MRKRGCALATIPFAELLATGEAVAAKACRTWLIEVAHKLTVKLIVESQYNQLLRRWRDSIGINLLPSHE